MLGMNRDKPAIKQKVSLGLVILAACLAIWMSSLPAAAIDTRDPVEANAGILLRHLNLSELSAYNAAKLMESCDIGRLIRLELDGESETGWRITVTTEDSKQYYIVISKSFGITLILENSLEGKIVFSTTSPIPPEDIAQYQKGIAKNKS